MQTKVKKIDPRLNRQATMSLLYSAHCGDLAAIKRHHHNHSNVAMAATNFDNRTALHAACAEGHLQCVKFLVETCGLDPKKTARWGFTPMSEAARFKHESVVDYLNDYMSKQEMK